MKYFLCFLTFIAAPLVVHAVEITAGSGGPTNEPTVITSNHMQADYVSNYGTFEGEVLVVDPRGSVRADKMVVYFGATNNIVNNVTNSVRAIQRIIATGSVIINSQDGKLGKGEQADYTTADSKVILTGHPSVKTSDGVVTGKKITIWQGSQKMDVESDTTETNRSRLLIYPEEQRKKSE